MKKYFQTQLIFMTSQILLKDWVLSILILKELKLKEVKISRSRCILKHYLVDTYYGKKLNLKSNGRSGGTSNLFFEKGLISYKDLLKLNPKLLYITETIGHGSNLVTGDYSVGAMALWLKMEYLNIL